LLLFAVVFYWTPPHFWALSMRLRGTTRAAGVPMLPVVAGVAETNRQIVLYTLLMVALTLAFFAVAHMGLVFLAGAILLGGCSCSRHGDVARRYGRAGGEAVQVLDHILGRAVRSDRPGRLPLPAALGADAAGEVICWPGR
jgi:4-hydroxybenzoate polyprenyltransferase